MLSHRQENHEPRCCLRASSFETLAGASSSESDRKSSQHFRASANSLKLILFSSWPGLSRPSTSFLPLESKDVDARHKAGHDELMPMPEFTNRSFGQTLRMSG